MVIIYDILRKYFVMIYCNDILIYYIDIDSSWVFLFDIGLEIENNIFVFGLSNIVVNRGYSLLYR